MNSLAELSGFDLRTVKEVLSTVTATTRGHDNYTLREFCGGLKEGITKGRQPRHEFMGVFGSFLTTLFWQRGGRLYWFLPRQS